MTNVEIEIFRDTDDEFRGKIKALYELLPKGVEVTMTESLVPLPIENNPEASAAQLLSFEMQRLGENRHYRARYVSTTAIAKTDLIEILEAAGFVIIHEYQPTELTS
jgi:hypothetical protein